MAIIEVTALSKYYGKYMSIEQVSFAVEKGEIFGIVGGEDAGKTTVLDIVAGAVKPTSGSCKVCGLDVQSNAQQVARMIRVISQTGETYSRLRAKTVDKYLKGISADAARQRAQRWCAYFGIENSEVIRKMSRQKKTALYMIDVLLGMPRILMLDAPFDGADQEFIGRMTQFLRNENKRGLTVVLTAREESQIAHLCSRIVHMNEGRLQEAAPAAQQEQDDFIDDDLMQYAQEAQRHMQNEPAKSDPFPQQDFAPQGNVPQGNAPQENYPQEQYAQQPQEQFAPRAPYAQQPYARREDFAQAPQQSMQEDPEFAQMRRDFYAQNTVRQPQVQPQMQQAPRQSRQGRANSDDMFRRLEEDFFEPAARQDAAPYAQQPQEQPNFEQDFGQTRRISMPQAAYAMRGFTPQAPSAPSYEQEAMQQTRAIPRFDASFSRPYAQAEPQRDRYADYGAYERAYEPYERAGAHAAAEPARSFAEYEPSQQMQQARHASHAAPSYAPEFEQEMYRAPQQSASAYDYRMQEQERIERPAHAKHAADERPYAQETYRQSRFEEPRFGESRFEEPRREEPRRASHAASDYDAYSSFDAHQVRGAHVKQEEFDTSRHTSSHRAYEPQESRSDDFYQSRESRQQSAYSEPAGAHSRHSAEYEPVRGAHARAEERAQEPAFEGKHSRAAHSEEANESASGYTRYTQQETTRSKAAHAASHAKETPAYPLYSSHHNASVHVPATQGNRRIVLVADNVPMEFLRNIGATGLHQEGDRVEFFFNGQMDKLIVALSQMNVRDLRVSLDVPVSGFDQE